MEELKRIIDDSEITKEDDALWPPPDRVGRQVCLSLYGRMGQGILSVFSLVYKKWAVFLKQIRLSSFWGTTMSISQ